MGFVPDRTESSGGFVPDSAQASPQEDVGGMPSWDEIKGVAKHALISALPGGAALKAGQLLDKAAYKAGGHVTDYLAPQVPPEVAAGAGALANVAVQAAPSYLGGKAMTVAAPALEAGAKRLMWSAMKPNKFARTSGGAEKAVNTALKEGVNVTEGGVEKLTTKIDALDDLLDNAIRNATANGKKIDAMKHIKEVLAEYRLGPNHPENLASIRRAAGEFFNNPAIRGSNEVSIPLMQKMKRAYYKILGDTSYGAGLTPKAERDANKAIARGLKEEIERVVPEAASINKPMGDLINARDVIADRVLVSMNKNPIGLGMLVTNPKAMIPWLADRSELAKSAAANLLYAGREQIPVNLGRVGGALYGAGILGESEKDYQPGFTLRDYSR